MRVLNIGNIFGFPAARKGGKAIIEVDPSLDDQFLEATFFSGGTMDGEDHQQILCQVKCVFFSKHIFFQLFSIWTSFFQVDDETWLASLLTFERDMATKFVSPLGRGNENCDVC